MRERERRMLGGTSPAIVAFGTLDHVGRRLGCVRRQNAWSPSYNSPYFFAAMANPQLVKLIKEDLDGWNRWKGEHPGEEADLSGADLERCDLAVADLAGVNLCGASLIMANLKAADLRGADLSKANLVGARMIGVDLINADLSGADLRTAEDLTKEQLAEAKGDSETLLPDYIDAPKSWR